MLIPFPFTDLTGTKLRPALVLIEGNDDCVVASISSKMPSQPSPTEVLIPEDHEEYAGTGLKRPSVLKLDKVATISKNLVLGEIGEVGEVLRKDISRRLQAIFQL